MIGFTEIMNPPVIESVAIELEPDDGFNKNQIYFGLTILHGFNNDSYFTVFHGNSLILNVDNSPDDITLLLRIGGEQCSISQDSVELSA